MGLPSGSNRRQHSLWQVTLPSSPESEDAISEALWDKMGQRPSFYRDEETQTTVAHLYFPAKPGRMVLAELTTLIHNVRQSGLHVPKSTVRIARLARQDWAESWKRHFKPLQIGRRLLVRPSWINRRGPKGSAVVVLDPGLSFGTGQHPTTRFCLEQLVKRRHQNECQSFLDVGSGSGILAIAAKKIGYGPVDALEIDPDAVRIARRNLRKNHLGGKVRIVCKDLSLFRAVRHYDLICANLIFDLLIDSRKKLLQALKPDGALVLAGILKSQFPQVMRAYERLGFEVIARRAEGEWESTTFHRRR